MSSVSGQPGLEHVLGIHAQVRGLALGLGSLLGGTDDDTPYNPPGFSQEFPDTNIGAQFQSVAEMIVAGAAIPVHKVSRNGFDTHANQVDRSDPTQGTHTDLLTEIDQALAAFRSALIQHGRWNDVLVMTYAEFGRRVKPNASAGTDHGSASVHLIHGGSVRGGLFGAAPSLAEDDLERGDAVANVDFRDYFTTAADFLGLDTVGVFSDGAHTGIPCL